MGIPGNLQKLRVLMRQLRVWAVLNDSTLSDEKRNQMLEELRIDNGECGKD